MSGFENGIKSGFNWFFSGKPDRDVQKAQLTFHSKDNNKKSQQWDVMLNPNSIRRRVGKQTRIEKDANKDGDGNIKPIFRDEHLSMQLVFDLVDAYDAYINGRWNDSRTLINMAVAGGVKDGQDNSTITTHKYPSNFRPSRSKITEDDITLENPNICCLPYLIQAAGSLGKDDKSYRYVSFAWGGLMITGYITDLSIDYTYFSQKGYPLRAYVDLTIYRKPESQVKIEKEKSGNGDGITDPGLLDTKDVVDPKSGTSKGLKRNLSDIFIQNGYATKDPCFIVKLNGIRVDSDSDIMIDNMSVTLSSGFESSICTFTVSKRTSRYDKKLSGIEFDEKIKKFTELGSKIEVCMGYGDEKTCRTVFKGNIYTVDFNCDTGSIKNFRLEVEAMDVKAFMMNNQRSLVHSPDAATTTYGQLVLRIVEEYSQYCEYEASKVTISPMPLLGKPIWQREQSDYDFIVSLAKNLHYLFYVVNGVVYFGAYPKPNSQSLDTVVITPCKYLIDFSREITLANQVDTVRVRANNEADPDKPIESTASNSEKLPSSTQAPSNSVVKKDNGVNEKLIIDPSVKNTDEAGIRARAENESMAFNFAKGKFKIMGFPDIEPGKYVEINDITLDVNKSYLITEVRHEFREKEYFTYCKFGASEK